jgi:hypothetical protein
VSQLQATWLGEGRLLFWGSGRSSDHAWGAELPELADLPGERVEISLAMPGEPLSEGPKRRRVEGRAVRAVDALPLLMLLATDRGLSPSVRCWAMAARLGVELAARHAVAPTARRGEARWRAVLSKPADHSRFSGLVQALPVIARAVPTRDRGPIRLQVAPGVMKDYLDAICDGLYRSGAYAGTSARGWSLEFADALRGVDPAFQPRDARFYSVPDQIAAWSRDGGAGARLGLRLHAPAAKGRGGPDAFWLELLLFPAADTDDGESVDRVGIPLDKVWGAGGSLTWRGATVTSPAWHAISGLARARRVFPPLSRAREASEPGAAGAAGAAAPGPVGMALNPHEAFLFWSEGMPALRDAGFRVDVPETFRPGGSRRVRVRMRLEATGHGVNLGESIRWRWEVVLGDHVLSPSEVAEIRSSPQRVVRFRGDWVLIDPEELQRLPEGKLLEGRLDAALALRAILTGQHEGIPVVADERLHVITDALRAPPDRPLPAGLHATLRPYQVRGFAWLGTLADLGLGACLADDMGLGKTVQVIAHLLDRRATGPRRPSLVVCPTTLLGNWTRELARFAPSLRVARHHGLHRDLRGALSADVVLTTYGLLGRDIEEIGAVEWNVVVLDEAQAIKNPESQRARAAIQLHAAHRVAMTGTPVENRLDELWSLMRFLVPGLLGPRAVFRRTVAIPVEKLGDVEVARRLRLGTSPFMLRRVKSDPAIVQDLPDKVERPEQCGLSPEQGRLYRQVAEEHLERIRERVAAGADGIERRGQVLAMLTALKQVCNHPAQYLRDGVVAPRRSGKLVRTIEILEAVFEAGERAILFTQYREMGDLLAAAFERHFGRSFPFLHGTVSVAERDEMIRRFQEDEGAPPLLLISLRAGGVGINLTRATHVVHFDRWWNPAVEDQATDRAYRIGQHRNVQVYKLVCQGTYEERIAAMLEEKRGLAESVVGHGERLVTELDDEALRALVALGDDAVVEDE